MPNPSGLLSTIQSWIRAVLYADGADVGAANPLPVSLVLPDDWHPTLLADETADDSDKSFAVPADTEYQVLWIWVELTTTATAGNRQMTIEIQDSAADVIGRVKAGIVQAASLTRNYMFAPALADLTAFRDTAYLMTPLPPTLVLPEAFIVRVYDSAAVAAAADDMIVQIGVALRTV